MGDERLTGLALHNIHRYIEVVVGWFACEKTKVVVYYFKIVVNIFFYIHLVYNCGMYTYNFCIIIIIYPYKLLIF